MADTNDTGDANDDDATLPDELSDETSLNSFDAVRVRVEAFAEEVNLSDAANALEKIGFRLKGAVRRDGFQSEITETDTMFPRTVGEIREALIEAAGGEVDLHWTFYRAVDPD